MALLGQHSEEYATKARNLFIWQRHVSSEANRCGERSKAAGKLNFLSVVIAAASPLINFVS